jgi:hypothetical protein
MRLLNSLTVLLDVFPDDRIPQYAILSHRWEDDEVSFEDMQNGNAKQKKGYVKIQQTCQQAVKDGYAYVWIDTCCIDKSSSAELSECLNSMYQWYENSTVCYAYLCDVLTADTPDTLQSSFRHSVWFTRGWTLQELIASPKVIFYSSSWDELGTKETLTELVSTITGIHVDALKGTSLDNFTIATRMSWASKRSTTRIEDTAYCLLGLFGVYMPMLYGEGQRAFIRLQEEIIKYSDDHSIFAWTNSDNGYRGLLATSPADFQDCANLVLATDRARSIPYSLTNVGIQIELPVVPWSSEIYLAVLDCAERGDNAGVGIYLRMLPEHDQYARVMYDGADRRKCEPERIAKAQYRKIYVRQKIRGIPQSEERLHGFWLRTIPYKFDQKTINGTLTAVSTWDIWDNEKRIFKMPAGQIGTAGVIWYYGSGRAGWSFMNFGFDEMFNPVFHFDGGMWTNSRLTYSPNALDFWSNMESTWIPKAIKGDRLRGLRTKVVPKDPYGYPMQLSITEEVIDNQRMWVVDIYDREGTYLSHPSAPVHVQVASDTELLEARADESEENVNYQVGVKHLDITCDVCNKVSEPCLTSNCLLT